MQRVGVRSVGQGDPDDGYDGRDRQQQRPCTGEPAPALAGRMMEETRERGLLVGKGGLYGNVVRMAPPLTLTEDEAREGLGILIDSLEAVSEAAK